MRKQDQNAIALLVIVVFLTSALNGSLTTAFHQAGGPNVALGSSTSTSTSTTSLYTTSTYNEYAFGYGGGGGGGGGSPPPPTTTISQITTTFTTTSFSGSYWNNNSQAVADYLIEYGWNSTLNLLSDPHEPGCIDYVGGLHCSGQTFWTTSDNVPTCWTLTDFHFAEQGNACIAENIKLGAFTEPLDGMRYEAFAASPIITGDPQDHHSILLSNGTLYICSNIPCDGLTYGTINGVPYNIQSDSWAGTGEGVPNPNAGVDFTAPQAINAWLRGDLHEFNILESALVQDYTSSNYAPNGNQSSTWQLGQVMFVMRVGGEDNTSAFAQMQNLLWSLQAPAGWLPNTYSGFGSPSTQSHDPENQDAGLLPYSSTVINLVRSDFGKYNATSWPTS